MLHISDHAYDQAPWVLRSRPAELEPLSDRIFIGPVYTSHSIVDNCYPNSFIVILFIEGPASQERDSHCEKIVRIDYTKAGFRDFCGRRSRAAFNCEPPARVARAQWKRIDYTGCFHSWQV